MKMLLDIPEEFENDFSKDRFSDALSRLSADVHLITGNYEQETAAGLFKKPLSLMIMKATIARNAVQA